VGFTFAKKPYSLGFASFQVVFGIFSALGEYERELIRERILAGQKRARSQGIKIGRPSKLNNAVKTSVRLLRGNGMGIKQIAKTLEIGVGSVYAALDLQQQPQAHDV
jgi:DNA invertase Pin-like site-specific DNA recombinase